MNLITNTVDKSLELYNYQMVASNFLYNSTPIDIQDEYYDLENIENNIDFLLNNYNYYIDTFKYNNENKALLINSKSHDELIIPYFISMYIPRENNNIDESISIYSLKWGWNKYNTENNIKMLDLMNKSKNVNWMNSGLDFCSDLYKDPLNNVLKDAHTYCHWITHKMNKFGYYKTIDIINIEDIVPNPNYIEYLIFDNPIIKNK